MFTRGAWKINGISIQLVNSGSDKGSQDELRLFLYTLENITHSMGSHLELRVEFPKHLIYDNGLWFFYGVPWSHNYRIMRNHGILMVIHSEECREMDLRLVVLWALVV